MQTLLPSCPCEVWEKGGSDLKKQTPSYCAGLWSPLEVKFLSSAGAPTEYSNKNKRPVIIYRLGEGGERRILGGMTWFLGEQKGGSVVTEKPNGGISENFGRIQRGTTQTYLENEDMGGGGGIAKVIKLLGGFTSVK